MNRHSNIQESFNEAAALQLLPRIAPSSYAPSMATVVASDVKREVSRQAWEEMKPRIQQLYMDQNRPFPQVARALREEYGFEPTKRQFSRKAAEWGFKKNITRAERRVLLLNLLRHRNGELLDLADRRIHAAKLENLRKRYRDELSDLEEQPSSSLCRLSSQNGESLDFAIKSPRISREHTPSTEVAVSSVDGSSMDWVADAPPCSLPLSQLLEALEAALSASSPLSIGTSLSGGAQTVSLEDLQGLFCENNKFMAYDLDPPFLSTQQESVDAYEEDNEYGQLPWRDIKTIFFGWNESPLNEVYVFPKSSVKSPRTVSITSRTLSDSLKHQEIEFTNKISILKRSFTPDHPAIIATTYALARSFYEQGYYIKAERLFHQVEELQTATLGPTSLKTLLTSSRIADVFRNQRKYDQAWEVIKRIEPTILSLVNSDHELALDVMEIKSLLFDAVGDYQSAENLNRQVLQIHLQVFGPRDSRTRQSMKNLGVSLVWMKDHNGAEKLLRTALQIHSESTEPHNWRLYSAMSTLGWALERQKSYDESYSVLYDAVQRSKTSLGPEHLDTLAVRTDFAWNLYWQRRLKESEEIFREVCKLQCKLFGDSAYISIAAIQGFALALKDMERFGEAIEWLEKYFARSLDAYGPENEWTLDACEALGECYENEGRYMDALELFQKMVEKLRASGSIEHPAVAGFESYIEDIREVILREDRC